MKQLVAIFMLLLVSVAYTQRPESAAQKVLDAEQASMSVDLKEENGQKSAPDTYMVTLNVDMTAAEGDVEFDPDIHSVWVTGAFAGWAIPGENTDFEMQPAEKGEKDNGGNSEEHIYTVTFEAEEGDHEYKYFLVEDEPTWLLGEWAGAPEGSPTVNCMLMAT